MPSQLPSRFRPARARLALALLLFAAACEGSLADPRAVPIDPGGPPTDGTRPTRVLFIGNSLMAMQDVPMIVEALAAASGDTLRVRSRAVPGMMLRNHWESSVTRRALESEGPWDLVILQEVAVVSDTGRVYLNDYVGRFRRATAAPIALLSVWGPRSDTTLFDVIGRSFSGAAQANGAQLVPVGEAWRLALRRRPEVRLYMDEMYPSLAGAYLSALVIYQAILGKSPVGLPARLTLRDGTQIVLDESVAHFLQACARDAAAPVS